jgi:hypothetical protein
MRFLTLLSLGLAIQIQGGMQRTKVRAERLLADSAKEIVDQAMEVRCFPVLNYWIRCQSSGPGLSWHVRYRCLRLEVRRSPRGSKRPLGAVWRQVFGRSAQAPRYDGYGQKQWTGSPCESAVFHCWSGVRFNMSCAPGELCHRFNL